MIIMGFTPSKRPWEKISNMFLSGRLLTSTPSQVLSTDLSIPESAPDCCESLRESSRPWLTSTHPYLSLPTDHTPYTQPGVLVRAARGHPPMPVPVPRVPGSAVDPR